MFELNNSCKSPRNNYLLCFWALKLPLTQFFINEGGCVLIPISYNL